MKPEARQIGALTRRPDGQWKSGDDPIDPIDASWLEHDLGESGAFEQKGVAVSAGFILVLFAIFILAIVGATQLLIPR